MLKVTAMRFDRESPLFGWTLGICFSPGSLMVGLAWEVSPPSLFLTLPLLRFRIERAETDYDKEPWPWGWSLF
jgi:hypothetical protein